MLIRPLLWMHSLCGRFIDIFAIALENGVHPKHRITYYKEWFLQNIEPGWVVIDIGSNNGLMPYLLSKKAAFIYGIEIKKDLVREARESNSRPNIEYICADATGFDYSECRPVDCIILSNVLEHIDNRSAFLKAILKNVPWKAHASKKLLFRVPMISRDWLVLYKKEHGLKYKSDNSHFIEYTLESFRDDLSAAGINIVSYSINFGEIYAVCDA